MPKYQILLNRLEQLAGGDEEYKNFIVRSANDQTVEYIGVRVPKLRTVAQEIAKDDWREFLRQNTWRTHEEKLLVCLLPKYIRPKLVLSELLSYFEEVTPYLSNWALTDTLATKYAQFQEDKQESYKKIVDYVLSDQMWIVRFGVVLLMNNFLDDEYIDGALILVKNVKTDEYYVKMAIAWLLAEASIRYQDKVERVLAQIDSETAKFARQKMRDSRRIG